MMAAAEAVSAIPRQYNFAADILDRNLKAGRADKPAFIDPRGTWTYGQLAERVGAVRRRAALARRAARGAGADRAARHHRLADRVSRLPQIGRGRGAGQYADDRGRLSLHAGRQPRPRARRVGCAVPAFPEADRRGARPRTRHRLRRQRAWAEVVRRADDQGEGLHRDRADRARRYRVLALHLGLDRQAEGRGALPCRSQAHRRSLRRAVSQHHRERRLLFGRQAVLRLWPRQCADVSDVGRRLHGAAARPADAGRGRCAAAPPSGHRVLRGADLLRGVSGERLGAAARRRQVPLLRVGRRGAADRHRPALGREVRRRHPRRHRFDRDAAHLPVQPRRRREVRHHRQARAGLRLQAGRRGRRAGEEGRDGRTAHQGADVGDHVLEQSRAILLDVPRPLDPLGRQVSRGRAGLFRLLRPARRHA